MSMEENKEILRHLTQEFNGYNGDVVKIRALYERYLAADYVGHSLLRGDLSRQQRIESVVMSVPAMPDLNYSADDMLAEGDKVVTRYTARGTHKGTFMGIPATGKQIVVKGVEINRIVD